MKPEQHGNNRIPSTDRRSDESHRRRMTREEYERIMRIRQAERERQQKARRNTIICSVVLLAFIFAFIYIAARSGGDTGSVTPVSAPFPETNGEDMAESPVMPDWITVDLLPVNEYSRPGDKLDAVNGIVVHNTGNPGTTAEQNRSYYYNVSLTGETYVSSHFVIGIDGTIIQCVPLDEIAYCSNDRNADTLSIECCHESESGELSGQAYASLVKLTAWLCEGFELDAEDVIRHYDVTGKECPKYFTDNPDAWEAFLGELK